MNDKRSGWFLGLVLLRAADGIAFLIMPPINAIAGFISLFIEYRLWNKNQFWRNVTAYFSIPLGLLIGFVTLNTDLYTGIGAIIECIIAIVLLAKCWNEFTWTDSNEEDPKATKLWRNIVIGLIVIFIAIILLAVFTQ
jgi:Na+/proline symporter